MPSLSKLWAFTGGALVRGTKLLVRRPAAVVARGVASAKALPAFGIALSKALVNKFAGLFR